MSKARRIVLLVAASMMVVIMAASGVVSAAPGGKSGTAPNCEAGISKAQSSKGSDKMNEKAKAALTKNQERCKG